MYSDEFFFHSSFHENKKEGVLNKPESEPLCNCLEAFAFNGKGENKLREAGMAKPILTVNKGDECSFCGNYVYWKQTSEKQKRVTNKPRKPYKRRKPTTSNEA